MPSDSEYLNKTIQLAARGQFTCQPNPMVGCVMVKDDHIIGEGWHQTAGQAHAEINAIADAVNKGHDLQGATAYVSLEPCSHHGKTPPCVDALIAAKVARVVCATTDPNPQVAGKGVSALNKAGVIAIVTECEATQQAANFLNRAFFHRMRSNTPYVVLKVATTMDGKTADHQGESQWITGDKAREDVQGLRASSGAVLTGSGTQMADDPSLNVRIEGATRQPYRVLLDTELKLEANAKIIGNDGQLIVYSSVASGDKFKKLEKCLHGIRHYSKDETGLESVLSDLAGLEVNQVMVEAGSILSGAFIAEDKVDEIVHYVAPSILGDQARSAFNFPAALPLNEKKQFEVHSCDLVGDDIKITYLRSSA